MSTIEANITASDLEFQIAAPVPLISLYRRGTAYGRDIRCRVLSYLQQQLSKAEIARRLNICEKTVRRYQKAAEIQSIPVPLPKQQGGYRSSIALLNRTQIIQLGNLLLSKPKLTIVQLKHIAVREGIIPANRVPSDTTIWRAIKKLDFKHAKAQYIDPATVTVTVPQSDSEIKLNTDEMVKKNQSLWHRKLIGEEIRHWRAVQQQGISGQLNPYNLLFMDETNCRLYDQQHYAWATANNRPLLLQPKGQSMTFNIIATIGIMEDDQLMLHYVIVPPRRDYRGVPQRFKAYEFRQPKAAIDLGYSVHQIQHDLSFEQLVKLMKEQQLRIVAPVLGSDPDSESNLRAREQQMNDMRKILIQVRTKGKVGLLREMRGGNTAYGGGALKAFRANANDVLEYVEKLFIPWFARRKLQGLSTVCDEDTDGLAGCPDQGQYFSIPYVAPTQITLFQLERKKQQLERKVQRSVHRLQVYMRSNKHQQLEARQNSATASHTHTHTLLNRLKQNVTEAEQQFEEANNAWLRQQRSSSIFTPFQSEIRGGAGFKKKLSSKYLVWDGASSHGAVRVPSSKRKSFWHSLSTKLGMAGVIFLPPRSPQFNPIELVFGHIKHNLRSNCPDEGYTQTSLLNAIHDAFRRITPIMMKHWVQKCGYVFEQPDSEAETATSTTLTTSDSTTTDVDHEAKYESDNGDQLYGGRDGKDEKSEVLHHNHMIVNRNPNNGTTDTVRSNIIESNNVCADDATTAAKNMHIVCMDENGTVIRRKRKGRKTFTDIRDNHSRINHTSTSTTVTHDVVNVIEQLEQNPLTIHHTKNRSLTRDMDTELRPGIARRWTGLGPQL